MKITFRMKVVITLFAVTTFIFFSYAVYKIIISENQRFQTSMLILIGLTILGFLSIVYQLKTFRFYKASMPPVTMGLKLLWLTNLIYGLSLFVFSVVLLYSLYTFYTRDLNLKIDLRLDYLIPTLIALFALLTGVFLSVEASVIYKWFKNYKLEVMEGIDDIKGQQEE